MYKYIIQRLDINTDWADNTKQTGNNKIMIQQKAERLTQKQTIRKERQSEMRNSQRLEWNTHGGNADITRVMIYADLTIWPDMEPADPVQNALPSPGSSPGAAGKWNLSPSSKYHLAPRVNSQAFSHPRPRLLASRHCPRWSPLPAPERYDKDPGKCWPFLSTCSLVF